MFFYNTISKYPVLGFNALEYSINIQTPQTNIFKITITADKTVHIISDVYTGDQAKQVAALVHCISYLTQKLEQRVESIDLSAMIASVENVQRLEVASHKVQTARYKHLLRIEKNKREKENSTDPEAA